MTTTEGELTWLVSLERWGGGTVRLMTVETFEAALVLVREWAAEDERTRGGRRPHEIHVTNLERCEGCWDGLTVEQAEDVDAAEFEARQADRRAA